MVCEPECANICLCTLCSDSDCSKNSTENRVGNIPASHKLRKVRCSGGQEHLVQPVYALGSIVAALIVLDLGKFCSPTFDCGTAAATQKYKAVQTILGTLASRLSMLYCECEVTGRTNEHRVVAAAKKMAEHNLAGNLRTRNVARAVGCSEQHFCRLFKQSTGRSWLSYVNGLRVDRARALLGQDHQPMLDVAASCGFESISHFNRMFKKHTGQSPTAYRRSVQQ
jgi:AraC-like DNA-binding protein